MVQREIEVIVGVLVQEDDGLIDGERRIPVEVP